VFIETVTCDVCKKCEQSSSAASSSWVLLIRGDDAPSISYNGVQTRFVVLPWDRATAQALGVEHACGDACAVKAFSQSLGGRGVKTREIGAQITGRTHKQPEPGWECSHCRNKRCHNCSSNRCSCRHKDRMHDAVNAERLLTTPR
jgi:hypothetical protein